MSGAAAIWGSSQVWKWSWLVWSGFRGSGGGEAGRIEVELPLEPVAALSQNVRALLLRRMRGLFLKVIS